MGYPNRSFREKLRSITSHLGRFAKLMVWSPHFKKQDSLIRLFEYFRFSEELCSPASDYVFCAGKMEKFHGGMEVLKKIYQDETLLTRKLLAFKPRWVMDDQEYYNLDSLMSYIDDIYRMVSSIQYEKPDFVLKSKGDINQIHDELVALVRKIEAKADKFEYSASDKRFKQKVGEYQFKLPQDGQALYRIGNQMNHCVGSYVTDVKKNKCRIVVVYLRRKPVICLEVVNTSLRQAKLYDNELPDQEQAAAVAKWCQICGIDWRKCGDMGSLREGS